MLLRLLILALKNGNERTMDNYHYIFQPNLSTMALFQAFLRLPMRKEICFEGGILPLLHASEPRSGKFPCRMQVYVICLLGPDTMAKGASKVSGREGQDFLSLLRPIYA